MALATTCPQCKTSFKVVPDQLKLRRGLVRCGVCQHVFSGIDYLRYVDDAARAAQKAARAATEGVPPSAGAAPQDGSRWPADTEAVPASGAPARRDPQVAPSAAAAPWAALAAPQDPSPIPGPRPLQAPPDAPRADPWAAAAAAAHERSLRDDAAPPGATDPGRSAPIDAGHRTPGRPDTRGGQPTLPWPAAPGGRQTVIGAEDDLKTAFFLTDSSFGPYPGEQTDVMPPTSIHRPGSQVEPTTFIRGELEPAPALPAPALPGLPLRPEAPVAEGAADPPAGPRPAGPMPVPLRAATATAKSPEVDIASIPVEPASVSAEPAIDYFRNPRHRDRGLGLALSPVAWAGAAVLSLLLLGQAVVGWRDSIASGAPALAPALAAVLGPFGLKISPPRDLSSLTIESFELQSGGAPNLLQMSAVLRNRSGHAVGFPAMELTLTDSAGGLLVRKLIPADTYLAGTAATVAERGIEPRSEWPVKLALELGGPAPTGYSVALFYP